MKKTALFALAVIGVLFSSVLLFLATYGGLTILAASEHIHVTPIGTGDVAAWIQAVGSIAAILAVWWTATYQSRTDKLAQASDRVAQLRAVADIVERLAGTGATTVGGMKNIFLPRDRIAYAKRRLKPMQAAVAALDRIEWHTLPNAYISVYALNAANLLDHMIGYTRDIAEYVVKDDKAAESWQPLFENGELFKQLASTADRIAIDVKQIDYLASKYDGFKDPDIHLRDI